MNSARAAAVFALCVIVGSALAACSDDEPTSESEPRTAQTETVPTPTTTSPTSSEYQTVRFSVQTEGCSWADSGATATLP